MSVKQIKDHFWILVSSNDQNKKFSKNHEKFLFIIIILNK